jgi:hypothetical protein
MLCLFVSARTTPPSFKRAPWPWYVQYRFGIYPQPHGMPSHHSLHVCMYVTHVTLIIVGHCRFGRIPCRMQRPIPSCRRLRRSPRLDGNFHILPHLRPGHVNRLGSHHPMAHVTATARRTTTTRRKVDSIPAKQRPLARVGRSLPAVLCTHLGTQPAIATQLGQQFVLAISLRVTSPPAPASKEDRLAALRQSSLGPESIGAIGIIL